MTNRGLAQHDYNALGSCQSSGRAPHMTSSDALTKTRCMTVGNRRALASTVSKNVGSKIVIQWTQACPASGIMSIAYLLATPWLRQWCVICTTTDAHIYIARARSDKVRHEATTKQHRLDNLRGRHAHLDVTPAFQANEGLVVTVSGIKLRCRGIRYRVVR